MMSFDSIFAAYSSPVVGISRKATKLHGIHRSSPYHALNNETHSMRESPAIQGLQSRGSG